MGTTFRDLSAVRKALLPMSWLYGAITDLRNFGYDHSWFSIGKTSDYVISVGNLTVGGTGKTPMIEFLVRVLLPHYRIAIVSRGYGRKTKGVVVATSESTAAEIGDEPLQYYQKFNFNVPVVVAEKRLEGAQSAKKEFPNTHILLLDDAFQHRAIHRDLNILLTDYHRPFYKDHPFPAGNLRERRRGANRADLIVVTKCPSNLDAISRQKIRSSISRYLNKEVPIIFSTVQYGSPLPFLGQNKLDDFTLRIGLSGLAQNQPFENYVRQTYGVEEFKGFADHFDYSANDLRSLGILQNPDAALLTTEKDKVKLLPLAQSLGIANRCFFLPIQPQFNEEDLAILMHLLP